jgi:ribonuclease P protein component
VRRNRAKRLLREAYRRHKHRIPAVGVQVVLVARFGCGTASFSDVERDFIALLTRAGFAPDSPSRDSTNDNEASS